MSTEQKTSGKNDPKVEQLIKEGIAAARAGDKATARAKLREAVGLDQYNEKGWFWLASVVDSEEERRVCLGNVVVINPNNERAQQMLEKLTGGGEGEAKSKTARASVQASPATRRTLLIVLVGVVVLLLLVLVLFRGGGESPAPTPTTIVLGASPVVPTAILATSTLDELSMTQTAEIGASQTVDALALIKPTLPPTWTASVPPRPRGTLTSTPLATPPMELSGHLVAISGKALTLDKNLPLVLIDLAKRQTSPLTASDRGDYGILTPNGKRVIFSRYVSGTESLLLRIMNLNGTLPEEISALWRNQPPLANQQMVSLSRNGKVLIFAAQNVTGENETTTGIYYVPVNYPLPGQEPTETPTPKDTPTEALTATLAPGQSVQPTSAPRPTLTPTLTVEPVQVKRLTEKNQGVNTWPDVSADGKLVVFVSDRTNIGQGATDIYVMSLAGGAARNLTNDSSTNIEAAPQWSPDGSQIVFQSKTEEKGSNDIYVMNADGSGARKLVTGGDNIRPRWSPDGKYIAFTSSRTGKWEIFILEVQSGTLYQLTSTPDDIICTDWGR